MVTMVTSGAGFAGGMGAITVVRTTLVTTGTYPSAYIANDLRRIAKYPTHRRLRQLIQQAQQLQPRRRYQLVVVSSSLRQDWQPINQPGIQDLSTDSTHFELTSLGGRRCRGYKGIEDSQAGKHAVVVKLHIV